MDLRYQEKKKSGVRSKNSHTQGHDHHQALHPDAPSWCSETPPCPSVSLIGRRFRPGWRAGGYQRRNIFSSAAARGSTSRRTGGLAGAENVPAAGRQFAGIALRRMRLALQVAVLTTTSFPSTDVASSRACRRNLCSGHLRLLLVAAASTALVLSGGKDGLKGMKGYGK